MESHGVILIDIINNDYAVDDSISEVRFVHFLLVKGRKVKFQHILREQNKVANYLTKMTIENLIIVCTFKESPTSV